MPSLAAKWKHSAILSLLCCAAGGAWFGLRALMQQAARSNNLVSLPIFHLARNSSWQGMGVFVEASIGNADNAQYVTLLLDSGSSALAVISKDTSGEPGALPMCDAKEFHNAYLRSHCAIGSYDLKASTSARLWPVPDSPYCQLVRNISVGSLDARQNRSICLSEGLYGGNATAAGSGFVAIPVRDALSLGSLTADVPVNAISYMFGPFQEPPSSGIMGLSSKLLNCANSSDVNTCLPGALDSLLSARGVPNKLGFCLGQPPSLDDVWGNIEYGSPGLLTLGGAELRLFTGEMRYSELISDTRRHAGFFSVTLGGIGVNSVFVSGVDTVAIVDTGNPTGISLPTSTLVQLSESVASQKCNVDADCILDVQLAGACLKVVDMLRCDQTGHSCFVPFSETSMSFIADNETMIGYDLLKDLYLEFDRDNNQLGFAARSDNACDGPCSEILAEQTCSFTKGCSWENGECTGGMFGSGSKSRGSKVVAANECFIAAAGTRANASLRGSDSVYP